LGRNKIGGRNPRYGPDLRHTKNNVRQEGNSNSIVTSSTKILSWSKSLPSTTKELFHVHVLGN